MFSRSAKLYDAVYSFKDYASEAARLHALIQERAPGARTLLDVACGTGKHLEQLSRHYAVEGLDLDGAFLAIARERLPGVPLHEADMVDFDLGRRFDAVVCLFRSIGYARSRENLGRAVAAMGRHVEPGGLVVVEPWILPERWQAGHVAAVFVDEPELKVARINISAAATDVTAIDFHYLVGTPAGGESFTERHELGLFPHDAYVGAFRDAGLAVEHDPDGIAGRGLYIGARPRNDGGAGGA